MRIKASPGGGVMKLLERSFTMTSLKDLTPKFRHVRLLLAREKGHPEGDAKRAMMCWLP